MKCAIVTGANGFIGSALSNYLSEQGYKVYAIVRSDSCVSRDKNITYIEGAYDTYKFLDKKISEEKIDFFFHMAWDFQGKNLYDYGVQARNVVGACEAILAAKKLNVRRFIFMNSFFVYKKDYYIDSANRKMASYCSIYGSCKENALEATRIIAHQEGVEHVSALLSNIFGVGDKSNRAINTMLKLMLKGQTVPVIEGQYLYDYIYIDDAVRGILAIAERGTADEEYYLGNNALRAFKDFVLDMREAVNPNATLDFGAFPDTSFIDFREIDLYKIYRDTGFVPKSNIYESFRKTAEWIRKNEENTSMFDCS